MRSSQVWRVMVRACRHHIKNTRMTYRTPETFYGGLPYLFLIQFFSTLLITRFIITFIKCSVTLYLTFYLLFFFSYRNFQFSCTCDQLNTLNYSLHEALQVLLLFIMQQEIEQRLLCM